MIDSSSILVRAVCRRLAAHKEEREAHIKAADAVRLRLRQLAGSCSIAEGARALKTSAPLGVSVAAERPLAGRLRALLA